MSSGDQSAARRARLVDHRVLGVLEIIRISHADPNLNLAGIAPMLSVSESRLRHLLARDTGHGFLWHLHSARTRQAASLLSETQWKVKEISVRVGYANASSLYRQFKHFLGCAPGEYRWRTRDLLKG